jgi:ABC-type sugar transport system permease subunit
MKKKTQELFYGYLFVVPVIIGVILFTVYPMATSFWYSLTSYNPLSVQKDRISINLQEELDIQLGITADNIGDAKAFAARFDPVEFLTASLNYSLDDHQKSVIATEFDYARLVGDLKAGRLDRIVDGTLLFKSYIAKHPDEAFPAYRPEFVGLANFVRMFTADQYFGLVLGNTFFYAIFVVLIQTFIAVILAVAANAAVRGVGVFKLIYFIPAITSSSAISMIFWMIYSKPGVLNQLLHLVGLPTVDWLNDPSTALPAVMALNIWTTAGFFMLTFLAGLQNIPRELYEAAEIDGANDWTVFRKLTLPMLRPQIMYVMIMGTIGCMQVFDQIYYLCGTNMRTATMAFYIYKNGFFFGNMGYASAIALVLFVIILGMTILQRRFIKESLV